MTNSIASNYVTQSMNLMVQSITTSTNTCNVQVNSGQYFFISGGNSVNCTVTATGSSKVISDMSCYASTVVINDVSNSLAQAAQQAATSVQQQFGLLAFSESINIAQSYMNLSNVIQTAFYNSCITKITTAQVAVIDCENSTNFTADVNFDNTIEVTQDCVFKNGSVSKIQNDLTQYIDQVAYSEIKNYVAAVLMAFSLVLFAFAAIIFLVLILLSPKKKAEPPPEEGIENTEGTANIGSVGNIQKIEKTTMKDGTVATKSSKINAPDFAAAFNSFSNYLKS